MFRKETCLVVTLLAWLRRSRHAAGTPNSCKRAPPATSSSHTTPRPLQVTLTTEPAAGFVYLAASRCRCRYALTCPLTAYPGPIHWSHISDNIFTIICILCFSQAPKAAPPTVCWPTDCGHRHSTDPLPITLCLSRQRSSPLPWASDRLPAFETLHSEGANLRLRLHPSDT